MLSCIVNTATTTLFLTNKCHVPFTVYYYGIENYFTSVARVFISLLVLLSYPLQIHPARRCVLTVIAQCKEWSCSKSISSKYPAKAAGAAEASPRLRSAGPAAAVVYTSLAAGTSATSLLAARSCSPRSLPLLNSGGGGSSGKLTGGSSKSSHSSTSSSSVKSSKLLSPDEELEQTTCAGADHCSTTTATILGCSSSRSEDFLFMVVTVSYCIVVVLI